METLAFIVVIALVFYLLPEIVSLAILASILVKYCVYALLAVGGIYLLASGIAHLITAISVEIVIVVAFVMVVMIAFDKLYSLVVK